MDRKTRRQVVATLILAGRRDLARIVAQTWVHTFLHRRTGKTVEGGEHIDILRKNPKLFGVDGADLSAKEFGGLPHSVQKRVLSDYAKVSLLSRRMEVELIGATSRDLSLLQDQALDFGRKVASVSVYDWDRSIANDPIDEFLTRKRWG